MPCDSPLVVPREAVYLWVWLGGLSDGQLLFMVPDHSRTEVMAQLKGPEDQNRRVAAIKGPSLTVLDGHFQNRPRSSFVLFCLIG